MGYQTNKKQKKMMSIFISLIYETNGRKVSIPWSIKARCIVVINHGHACNLI